MLVDLDAKGENMDTIDSIRDKSEHSRASHQELLTMIPCKSHSLGLFDHARICDSWCLHIIQLETRLRQKSKFSQLARKNCYLVPLRIRLPASNLFLRYNQHLSVNVFIDLTSLSHIKGPFSSNIREGIMKTLNNLKMHIKHRLKIFKILFLGFPEMHSLRLAAIFFLSW
jgi:hypothetical protein